MSEFAAPRIIVPKLIVPTSWHLTKHGAELIRDVLDATDMRKLNRYFKLGTRQERVVMMAGSDANYLSAKIAGLVDGKTAYAGETTYYIGLYTGALDDTVNGATANEAAYTSYARLSLTNNGTIFAPGTGTATVTDTWPSDAIKSWPTSTGSTATIVDIARFNGNAGTSSDKAACWATVTSQVINSGDTPQLAQNAVTQIRD